MRLLSHPIDGAEAVEIKIPIRSPARELEDQTRIPTCNC
jgi:hypothetical protein